MEVIDKATNLIKLNWNPVKIEGKQFSFKSIFSENSVEILLFDLNNLSLFYFIQNHDEIMESFKEFNPSLEAPIRSIVNHLSDNFTFNSQTNEKIFSFDGETSQTADSRVLKLNMNSKLSGAKFRWNFQFERLDNTYLRLHVLLPLIYSSAEFQLREQELFRLVQAKDKEIEDFKSQGHKLSRKHLATEDFTVEAFDEKLRKEGKDTSDQPEKYLYTPLAHKINETIIPKYMAELVRQKVVVKNEVEVNLSSVEISKSAKNESAAKQVDKANTTTKTSQKESRKKEELTAKPKDEEQEKAAKKDEEQEKAKNNSKKKKLFK